MNNNALEKLNQFRKNMEQIYIDDLINSTIFKKEQKNMENKISSIINYNNFFEVTTEFSVLNSFSNQHKFVYEPTTQTNHKNPECSFEYEGKVINIECKSRNLPSNSEGNNVLKIIPLNRSPLKLQMSEAIKEINKHLSVSTEEVKLNDNKLKDYLDSFSGKVKGDRENDINILFISLSSTTEMDNYYNYLHNITSGIFTNSSFIKKDNNQIQTYDSIDGVVLIDLKKNHDGSIVSDCWKINKNNSAVFILNPNKTINCSAIAVLLLYYIIHSADFNHFKIQAELCEDENARVILQTTMISTFFKEKVLPPN
jgi:ribosomal protein L31E